MKHTTHSRWSRSRKRPDAHIANGHAASKNRYERPPFPPQHQSRPGAEHKMVPAPLWRGDNYKAAGKLRGRCALITGGDSGIGRAVAFFFAKEGADVAIACLPAEKKDAELTRDAIQALGRRCLVLFGDLVQPRFATDCIHRTVSELGALNILVHNAAQQSRKNVEDLSERELDRTMKTNVYAYLRLARAAVPVMKPGSSIIATGSIVGLHGSERLSDYSATKGAIHAITKTLAEELIDRGIRVNCVAPGPVWTPLNVADKGTTPKEVSRFGQETGHSPMGRPAQPEEVAPAFVFLASEDDSSYITGAIIPVTGGPV